MYWWSMSLFRATLNRSRAVADKLGSVGTVDVVDSDAAPITVDGYDLLVVGWTNPRVLDDACRDASRSSQIAIGPAWAGPRHP